MTSLRNEETHMRKRWFWFVPLALAGGALLLFIGGEVVMHLWNWLLPPLFGWRTLTIWQAFGLLVLCRVLFGGLGGHGPGPRRHWNRRCRKMTREEREKFRQAMTEGYRFGATGEKATSLETKQ
jgi:hypothetical protein